MATLLGDIATTLGNAQPGITPEEEKYEALLGRKEPVNILVIGPVGSGKSTLVNAMFGRNVAEVGHGARAITTKVKKYEGQYKEVKISIYDTVGFGDTGGKSDRRILLDIAKEGKFDLILICSQLGGRADRAMFLELASMLHKEMWKRTVVVLTQADRLDSLGSVSDNDLAEEFRKQIEEYKECVSSFISKSVKKEVLENIPYCITGKEDEKELPTTDDWLKTLWDTCIDCSSEDTRSFLKAFAKYSQAIKVGAVVTSGVVTGASAGAGVGAKVGAIVGTVVSPGAGTVVGVVVGGVAGGTIGAVGAAVSKKIKNN